MERHPRTSPIGGSSPALVARPHAQARALARTHAQLWRTRAGQREEKDGGAQLPNAAARTCGPRRLQRRVRALEDTCCWTHLEAAAAEPWGARRARVPAGEGSGVLERRPRTEAVDCRCPPARRRCRPA